MLISFKVSNSRSIGAELEFSAIATDDSALPENTIALPQYGIKLLKTMAIFGANASGKTNILQALVDARNLVAYPQYEKKDIIFNFNKNNSKNSSDKTSYTFVFLVDNCVYNYKFSHNKNYILEEILTKQINSIQEDVIYSRIYDKESQKYEWTPSSFFEVQNTNFFRLSTAEHKLFLSIANHPVNPDSVEKNLLLEKLYNWFLLNMPYGSATRQADPELFLEILLDKNFENSQKIILDILKRVDININDIRVEEVNNEIGNILTPVYLFKNSRYIIKTKHQGNNIIYFDFFTEESHGTQQFINWLSSFLYFLQNNKRSLVFVIDELGTSLHPKLTLFFIRLFADKQINPYNSQLIFTTHEVKLMDRTIMRPDQLYLVNKDQNGDTTIERMSDYSDDLEKYTRFDTLYMNGGMSGIPNISLL